MVIAPRLAPLIVMADAGPLITLAYADSLDLLRATDNDVWIVDMVEQDVTRGPTPTSELIGRWIETRADKIVRTELFTSHREQLASKSLRPNTAKLGKLAAQEVMNTLARSKPSRQAIFLFEDHGLARTGFVLPDGCSKMTTRAWLRFLERIGRIESAWQVERQAVENGRAFSTLHFSSDDRVDEPAPDCMNYKLEGSPARGRKVTIDATPMEKTMTDSYPPRTARRGPNTVEILRLCVSLEDVHPVVSRTVLIRASSPLSTLHTAIQLAMDWQDSHLHEFEKDGVRYGPDWYLDEDPDLELESERKQLGTLFRDGSDTLRYLYDFGDSWRHTITVEARLPPDLSLRRPRCVDGRNACPPEDVGGVPGYASFVEIIADPNDEEHEDKKTWVGGDFDPTHFDVDAADARLAAWFPTAKRTKAPA